MCINRAELKNDKGGDFSNEKYFENKSAILIVDNSRTKPVTTTN